MTRHARTSLTALLLLAACSGDTTTTASSAGDTTDTTSTTSGSTSAAATTAATTATTTASTSSSSSASSASESDGSTSGATSTTTSTTSSSSSTTTTDPTTSTTADSTTGMVDPLCGSGDPIAGMGTNKMEKWGAPCSVDAECVALLGAGAECYETIAGVYKAPGGYCSKPCTLPNDQTLYVPNAPECGPGVTCLGVNGIFTACVPPCIGDAQCQRDGYSCKVLPQIGSPGDPKFCLMKDTCVL